FYDGVVFLDEYGGATVCFFFFFSSRRRHTRSDRDWSSDVCSSDLRGIPRTAGCPLPPRAGERLLVRVAEGGNPEARGMRMPQKYLLTDRRALQAECRLPKSDLLDPKSPAARNPSVQASDR